MITFRRSRGRLLRLVRRRRFAVAAGLLLVVPAIWLRLEPRYATWWTEGLGLVLGATGVALLWVGVAGLGPDWTDRDPRDRG